MPQKHNRRSFCHTVVTAVVCWASLPSAFATDLNLASEADLDSVRGIGPAMTARLLAERERQPFADWTDLQRRVKGIGAATAARWSAGGVTVNGLAYPSAVAQPTAAPSTPAAQSVAP